MRPFLASLLLLVPAAACDPGEPPPACSLFDLVFGQVPLHGTVWYEARAARSLGRLHRNCLDGEARLELARARARMGDVAAARLGVDLADPEIAGSDAAERVRIEAAVATGAFAEAAERADRLVARSPGALGVAGGLVPAMYRWLGATPARDRNFLGTRYADWEWMIDGAAPRGTVELARLAALLACHPGFADGFLVLGDELGRLGAPNLAAWSWARALQLGHPAAAEIRRRVRFFISTEASLETGGGPAKRLSTDADAALRAMLERLEDASRWSDRFAATEGMLSMSDPDVTLAAIEAYGRGRGLERLEPSDLGLTKVREELKRLEPRAANVAAARDAARRLAVNAAGRFALRAAAWLFLAGAAGVLLRRLPRLRPQLRPPLTALRLRRLARG